MKLYYFSIVGILLFCLCTVSNGFQARSDAQAGALNGLKSIAFSIPSYVKSFFQTKQEVGDQIEEKQNSIEDALDALLKVQNTTNHQVEHAQDRVTVDYQNCSEAIESLNCINLPIWQVQKDKHTQNTSIIQNDIQSNLNKINEIKDLIKNLMQEKKEIFQQIEPKFKKISKNIEVLKNLIKMAEENFNLTNSFAQISPNLVVFPFPETYQFLQSKMSMKENDNMGYLKRLETMNMNNVQITVKQNEQVNQNPQQSTDSAAQQSAMPPQNNEGAELQPQPEPQQQTNENQGSQQEEKEDQQQQGDMTSLEKPKIDNKTFQMFKDQLQQLEKMRDAMTQQKNEIENDINDRKSQFEADLQDILNVNSELKQQVQDKKQDINELEQQIKDCDYEQQLNSFCEQQKQVQQDFLENLVQEQALIQSAIDETNILINQAIQEGKEVQAQQNAEQQQTA